MNRIESTAPPKWPLKFLRFFVKKEFLEEIEGDLEEVFYDNLKLFSQKKARRMYTWEVIRVFRPILVKNFEGIEKLNQYGMFKNYFKISLRGLMKNPLNSFINIFGLAMAVGLCIFAYAFANYTYSTDQFHENKNSVFLTTFFADRDGRLQQYGTTPRPLAEMLRQDFSHITKVCQVEDRNVVVKYSDRVFHERVRFTDPEFLEMFTFPLKWGASGSLNDINSVVLSEEMAIKYFGEENPVGNDLLIKFDKDNGKAFRITGVAKAFPDSHTIEFDFLINLKNLPLSQAGYDLHDWNAFVNATFIQVDDPGQVNAIVKGMEKYKVIQNKAVHKEDWAIASFALEPLATLHERSADIRDDISWSSKDNYTTIIFLAVICLMMLALACFNYINIAIVSATKRLKEIGVRKSIGAKRSTVVIQFLTENMVITFFAMFIGILLAVFFFIPGFEQMWHFRMGFNLYQPALWIFLPVVLLLTSIASGIYPSLYISKFQVVGILKGSVKFGKKNPLTKVFLTLQIILACIFISMSVAFTQNTDYLTKRSWGYDQDQTLYALVSDQLAYEQLHTQMTQDPDVLSISGSTHHLGKTNATVVLHFPDRKVEADELLVQANYFQTMGIRLKDGRVFNDYEGSDRHAVVVNENFVSNLGLKKPIGEVFMIDSVQYEVIGVVKDFHSYSFSRPVRPTIFKVADKAGFKYLSIKAREGSKAKVFKNLQSKWAALFPETPFEGGHQQDVWGNYFNAISIHSIVWKVIAFIAVALASLGLYGLVTLNVAARTKEFSIRKILGAGIKNISSSIGKQYIILFAIALVIGSPLSYILTKSLIESSYTYHVTVSFSTVLIAVLILIMVLVATTWIQVRKVLKANPVNGLKVE